MSNDIYSGMSNVPAAGDGGINPGIYPAVLIKQIKFFQGFHGKRHLFVVVPLVPGQQINPDDPSLPAVPPTTVGTSRTCGSRLDGPYPDLGKADVKAATAVLMGLPEGSADLHGPAVEAKARESVGPDQPLSGGIFALETHWKKTKGGQKILKYRFRPADPNLVASLKGQAAAEMAKPEPEREGAAPPPPPAAAAFPPPGWWAHPQVPGSYYNAAGEIKTEAALRAG